MQVLIKPLRATLFATLLAFVAQVVLAFGAAEATAQDDMQAELDFEQVKNLPCIELKPLGRGLTKVAIRKSGHYCLTEDLHARVEWADRRAEVSMIDISTGDIVLDLQGHTLGRGRIFKNPGDMGIAIVDPDRFVKGVGLARHILIKNGVLQDFETGIYFGYGRSRVQDVHTFDPKTNTYHFPANNITLENITFKNNKKDFDIRVPPEPGK